jgi:hypothetical protein
MDNRTLTFRGKFESARSVLKAGSLQEVISLKFRGNPMPSEYSELIRGQHVLGLDVAPAKGDFSGQAWLVSLDRTSQIILVGHETGLEILYIAGSIASLIGLIPLAVNGWKRLRERFGNESPSRVMEIVEVRTLDSSGSLIEHNIQDFDRFFFDAARNTYEQNKRKIDSLEKQVSTLKRQLASKNKASKKSSSAKRKGDRTKRRSNGR